MTLRICIVGAGAIGGWLGVRLGLTGHVMSVLARGATLAAIRAQGLRLQANGQTHTLTVQASDRAEELGVQDLVIIAVKAPSLLGVARQVKPLLGPDTLVLSAMNGVPWWFFQGFGGPYQGTVLEAVDPRGEIAGLIPARQVLGGVVHASCTSPEPGLVVHGFGQGLIVGVPSGADSNGESVRAQTLALTLRDAGFDASVSPQIQRDVWFKLWGNLTMNPVGALTGANIAQTLADPLVRAFCSSVMLEAREIGVRLGLPIVQDPEDRHAVTLKLGAFKTSMLQDVQNHKPIELDALVGAVRELGQLTGVPTPQTDALLGLTRLMGQVHGLY
jgi:2-dehydropantoate 2-reductase